MQFPADGRRAVPCDTGAADAGDDRPRRARPADATEVAVLLHDFNVEFGTPTPDAPVLASRLEGLLAGDDVVALVAARPNTAVALLSFRLNVWYPGPVALLDELYVRPERRGRGIGSALLSAACELAHARDAEVVEINVDEPDTDARRFYERHGFVCSEPGSDARALYYCEWWRHRHADGDAPLRTWKAILSGGPPIGDGSRGVSSVIRPEPCTHVRRTPRAGERREDRVEDRRRRAGRWWHRPVRRTA